MERGTFRSRVTPNLQVRRQRWYYMRRMNRWRIAVLVFFAIAISYLDRQALAVAIDAIQKDIPLTNFEYGALASTFLLAYALMYAGGGALIDRLGTRRGFFVIMVFWSLACASHSLATGFWMLAASRFLLGAGEGGGFPAATKVIAERFPATERSSAMGLVNAGTAVGAVVAPPAIAAIISYGILALGVHRLRTRRPALGDLVAARIPAAV